MKRFFSFTVALFILTALLACTGCSGSGTTLNDIDLADFTIIYDADQPDYNLRAANYIHDQILARTGLDIPVQEVDSGTYPHELIVGETNRDISKWLNADTENVDFAIYADNDHILLEGDSFIIAAAAYYFVDTYIPGETFESVIPKQISIHSPITEKANNFIFLIGDGMGVNHTKMFEAFDVSDPYVDSDGEDIFYGYYLPHQGVLRTNSVSGTTDSAAGATALACGYKTINGYVGKDRNLEDVQSLTELALSKGMATAVLSTDLMTGATPAGFSAHANDRDDSSDILACQRDLLQKGTIISCDLNSDRTYQDVITNTLATLEESENGFFLMYEEAHIDKMSHNNALDDTFSCVVRFNQAIGLFMEHAFYHPDTFLLITADHETGGLNFHATGGMSFSSTGHTPADVPIFAYGQGTEVFADYNEENNTVPMVIAELWGVPDFGDQ